MRHKVLPPVPAETPNSSKADPGVVTCGDADNRLVPTSSPSAITRSADHQAAGDVFKEKLSAALGCKTSETALALIDQIVKLEHPATTMDPARINALQMSAIAALGELQPCTATEAMLAAQMVGTHRAAMTFLANATKPEDSVDGRDRNVRRALQLMHLFTEQVEAMSKLKGKGGQQRVVVEHVTVAAGGQAIVGAVMRGGGGGRVAKIGDEARERRRGSLKNGNPSGDWTTAPRCGASTRRQTPCQCPAMRNRRRCRMHGGKSTGPRTAAGLERSRRARWTHGIYSREARAILANERRQWRELWALLGSSR